MADAGLERRLRRLSPANLDPARERAKLAARVTMSTARANGQGLARSAAARQARPALFDAPHLAVLGALAALILVGLVATPPGRAFTSWVGDRVGLGEPGGHPTLQGPRALAMPGQASGTAYVLVRGRGPAGLYEYVTYRSKAKRGDGGSAGARCFELDLPSRKALQGAGCGLPSESMGLKVDAPGGAGGNVSPEAEVRFVSGRVSEDVASVDVKLNGRSIPVDLRPVRGPLAHRVGLPHGFTVFAAFFSHAGHGGRVAVAARDRAGKVVARDSRRLLDNVEARAGRCHDVERLVEEGALPRRFLHLNCAAGGGG